MSSQPRNGIPVLLIAIACLALVVAAMFTRGGPVWRDSAWHDIDVGEMSILSLIRGDIPSVDSVTTAKRYACRRCGTGIDWGSLTCPRCGRSPNGGIAQMALPSVPNGGMTLAALPCAPNGGPLPCAPQGTLAAAVQAGAAPTTPPAGPAMAAIGPDATTVNRQQAVNPATTTAPASLLSPREQNAAGKEFIEGHWLGLEVIPLTPELAAEYQVPKGENGILVDEITLESAESGILAGDMVQSVEGRPTPDLKAFFVATQRVQEKERADVGISRRGKTMSFFMEARNTRTLGFAQMEAAQPIQPGSISPHRSRGRACTDCHIIMATGGQLPTDAGDILPTPRPITKDAVAPHGNRGLCSTCHVIIK